MRRRVSAGKTVGIGLREEKEGRGVEEMSSFVINGKTIFAAVSVAIGFPRRDSSESS